MVRKHLLKLQFANIIDISLVSTSNQDNLSPTEMCPVGKKWEYLEISYLHVEIIIRRNVPNKNLVTEIY